MKSRPLLFIITMTLLLVAAACSRRSQSGQRQQASRGGHAHASGLPPVTVTMAPAAIQNISVYANGLGTVTALNTVTVKPQVDGQLVKVDFREGQFVRAGDLLAQVDPRPFQVQLQQAQATLARDEAQLKVAQVNLARDEKLKAAQVIAQQELDAQQALVGQLQGSVQMDQAQIASARLNLTYSRVVAPISGRVGLRLVDVGNIVHTTDTTGIVVLTQMQPIAVDFTLPEKDLPQLQQSLSRGQLVVDAYDSSNQNLIARGHVLALNNEINTTTGTEQVKAVFNNPDNRLWPNQFVNIRVLLRVDRNALVVPSAAIQHGPQGDYTFVVEPNQTARMQTVTVGDTQGNLSVIQSGLKPGQNVVTDGQDRLENGSKVHAQASPPPALQPRGGSPRQSR